MHALVLAAETEAPSVTLYTLPSSPTTHHTCSIHGTIVIGSRIVVIIISIHCIIIIVVASPA